MKQKEVTRDLALVKRRNDTQPEIERDEVDEREREKD